ESLSLHPVDTAKKRCKRPTRLVRRESCIDQPTLDADSKQSVPATSKNCASRLRNARCQRPRHDLSAISRSRHTSKTVPHQKHPVTTKLCVRGRIGRKIG